MTRLTVADLQKAFDASEKFSCRIPGCNVFPYDTAADRDEHEASAHRHGSFQTVPNGFGGTTTVRATTQVRTFRHGAQAAASAEGNPATDRMVKFLTDLVAEVYPDGSFDALRDQRIAEGYEAVSKAINALKAKRDEKRAAAAKPETHDHDHGGPVVSRTRHIANRRAQKCHGCDIMVAAGEGVLEKETDTSPWLVFHVEGECPIVDFMGVPEGRYGFEVDGVDKFYVLQGGVCYAQASDELHPVKTKASVEFIIETIKADPRAAAIFYGQHIGVCGRCGRTLTSSWKEVGLGPVCSQKGW